MEEQEFEDFKELFIRLSKSMIDPNEEKSEYDLGIDFSEADILTFEEEQKLREDKDAAIDRIADGLFFLDEE